jgi:hypothetical protein
MASVGEVRRNTNDFILVQDAPGQVFNKTTQKTQGYNLKSFHSLRSQIATLKNHYAFNLKNQSYILVLQ